MGYVDQSAYSQSPFTSAVVGYNNALQNSSNPRQQLVNYLGDVAQGKRQQDQGLMDRLTNASNDQGQTDPGSAWWQQSALNQGLPTPPSLDAQAPSQSVADATGSSQADATGGIFGGAYTHPDAGATTSVDPNHNFSSVSGTPSINDWRAKSRGLSQDFWNGGGVPAPKPQQPQTQGSGGMSPMGYGQQTPRSQQMGGGQSAMPGRSAMPPSMSGRPSSGASGGLFGNMTGSGGMSRGNDPTFGSMFGGSRMIGQYQHTDPNGPNYSLNQNRPQAPAQAMPIGGGMPGASGGMGGGLFGNMRQAFQGMGNAFQNMPQQFGGMARAF